MTEEALRLLARHPRLAENSGISTSLAALLAASSIYMPRWKWLFGPLLEPSDMGHITLLPRQLPELASSANLCSLLLRLISLALTAARAAACLPRGNEPIAHSRNLQAYCFHLWQSANVAVHVAFEFPAGMGAARGMAALLLQPALASLMEASPGRERTASASVLLNSFHAGLLSCCSDLPARLSAELLVSSPAWSVVEQEADCLMPGSAVRAAAADLDALAASLAEYLFSVVASLACSTFSVPPIYKAELTKFSCALLSGYAQIPDAFIAVSLPCLSSAFLNAAAECSSSSGGSSGSSVSTSKLGKPSDAVVILFRVLSSPVWDRVWGHRVEGSNMSSIAFAFLMGSLISAAAILEQQQLKEQLQLRHGMTSSASGGAGGSRLESSDEGPRATSVWQESRFHVTRLCEWVFTHQQHGVRDDVSGSISEALGKLREALSGIIGCECAPGGASCVVGALAAGSAVAGLAAASMGAACVVAAGAAAAGRQGGGLGVRDWELVQAELLLGLPEEMWGVRPCCNTACRRLEGPCEMEVKTRACGGGCGARYCCAACQEQAWRGGHRRNCAAMREMKDRRGEEEG